MTQLLLIEDNPGDARLIREMLRDSGEFEVTCAGSLREACERIAASDEAAADAILLDLGLPDSVGLETLATVLARAPDVPIVVLTGADDGALALRALAAGAQDYLTKRGLRSEQLTRALRYARERVNVERQLRARERELSHANDVLRETASHLVQTAKVAALGEMAAGIAHELSQPLSSIRLIAQSTLRYHLGAEPHRLRSDMEEVIRQVDGATSIIRHMRLFSRGEDDAVMEDLDINEVVRSAIRFCRQQIVDHGIAFSLDLTQHAPVIRGDAIRIEQCLLNLLTNARDACQSAAAAHKAIEVETRRRVDASGRRSVLLEVRDNGIGVSDGVKARIFEPFFTTKDPNKGTGLGLALVDRMMRDHGGSIEVESASGEGTSFRLVFPLDEAPQRK